MTNRVDPVPVIGEGAPERGGIRDAASILLAGPEPGEAAGLSMSSEILSAALAPLGSTGILSHRITPLPRISEGTSTSGERRVRLGVQPVTVHAEALAAAALFRGRLWGWSCAWAVSSRYAGAPLVAGIPYVVWEATTIRDELSAIEIAAVRRSGSGSGVGAALHKTLLPLDERLEGLFYRRARLVLAMSEHTRERILATHRLPEEAVHLLPPPPSLGFLDAAARLEDAEFPRAGSAADGLRLLFVGRVEDPRKNVAGFLDLVRALRAGGMDIRGTVVGPHSPQWRRAVDLGGVEPYVTLAGRLDTDDLVRAYRSHDLLVIPSRQEGYGIVAAEALHCGLPVVSTRCGGPEGMLRASGAGVLVGGGIEELRGVVSALGRDPGRRRVMSSAALTYAQRDLSFPVFAARVAEITQGIGERVLGRDARADAR